MKKALCLLACFISTLAICQPQLDRVGLRDMTDASGNRTVHEITSAVAEKQVAWDPEKQQPPLSVVDAVAIAKKWATAQYSKFEDLRVSSIELSPMCMPQLKNRWFYTIQFEPTLYGKSVYGYEIFVVVLFDKTVVPSEKKEPRKY